MEILNAIILLLNYTIIPALTYGSQLALGAIFVTLIYGVLRFANFATGDMMSFGTMFAVLLFSIQRNKFGSFTYSTSHASICDHCNDSLYVFYR